MSIEITTISCPNCSSKSIRKHSIQKNKQYTIQRYRCKNCQKTFTLKQDLKNKSYPTNIILNSISLYNLGYTQSEIIKLIAKKHKTKVPQTTISNWINEFKQTTPFNRLRKEAKQQFQPENIIETYNFLHNNLNYKYQIHQAKLNLLTKQNQKFLKIKDYLYKVSTKDFPHHIFKPTQEINNTSRASQSQFKILKIKPLSKQNLANKLCQLALNLAKTNKDRHQSIQNFMLTNDSTTIATEIPIYLTKDDLLYFNSRGFQINPKDFQTPITGHIDLLQIRNNLIHILDYKPESSKIKPIEQLTIYALALASKTKLPLTMFKCAWFDENNYYEFFPLHVVKEKYCPQKRNI